MSKWINKIHCGDALAVLKEMPDNYVDMVMTSPPYWGLRDYGSAPQIWDGDANCEHLWMAHKIAGDIRFRGKNSTVGNNKNPEIWKRPSREEYANRKVLKVCPVCEIQFEGIPDQIFCGTKCLNTLSNAQRTSMKNASNICVKCGAWRGELGLEPSFDLYIKHLCDIFDETKRVIKDTGTIWVNLGDTYSSTGGAKSNGGNLGNKEALLQKTTRLYANIQDKCLCMIPQRFAIEMINRGWILRNVIIWYKSNCMPSSIKDRFTVDFEYIYFFSKHKKYYFEQQFEEYTEPMNRWGGEKLIAKGKSDWDKGTGQETYRDRNMRPNEQGRNKRCVWNINTQSYPEAHFAVYPEELCITPIKAGCPQEGVVLDPFSGAGTTSLVAKKLQRNYIGIELNPDYVNMSEKRIHNEAGLI